MPLNKTTVRIGTRGSPLALWQAHYVAGRLRAAHAGLNVELVEIQTEGDKIRDVPLVQIGGEGVFTKAIQEALLEKRVDIAVHSLKDLPTIEVAGLVLAAVPERGPLGDVLISKRYKTFTQLPEGAKVATSSLRRRAQILHRRPDLNLVDMRGNVETRLRKLAESDLDAIILAQAGLERLGLGEHITEILDPSWMLPAVGQGALGLECRDADPDTRSILVPLDHPATRFAVLAERAMLRGLGGGCLVPIGAFSQIEDGQLCLRGAVLSPDGTQRIENQIRGNLDQGEKLGEQLAEQLLHQGARQILRL
jgi:hydroxymethylbilane synthase